MHYESCIFLKTNFENIDQSIQTMEEIKSSNDYSVKLKMIDCCNNKL